MREFAQCVNTSSEHSLSSEHSQSEGRGSLLSITFQARGWIVKNGIDRYPDHGFTTQEAVAGGLGACIHRLSSHGLLSSRRV